MDAETESQTSPQNDSISDLAAEANAGRSLKQRALQGTFWTVMGYGGNQVIRLGSNLVLTRLLFPEAFGLMALVQVFMQGLQMFSDIGIVPSIIQHKRGDDPTFLNTAWTIQVIRGVWLFVGACVLAVPAAWFYREPMLAQLLPVVGITALINGFNSTRLATVNRHLQLARMTILELGAYSVGVAVMILLAWASREYFGPEDLRSVWALASGGIVGALMELVLSHTILPGQPNRFCWDREAVNAIAQFGRWIFISTALTFFAGQGDRLLMGWVMNVEFLGIYTIAQSFSSAAWQLIARVIERVLFPSYSELVRDRPAHLYSAIRRSRLRLIAFSWSTSLFFLLLGQGLISFLYDDRYSAAGWMLQVLALGSLVSILSGTYDGILMAQGKTGLVTALLVIQIALQFAAMLLGFHFGGQVGVIVGLSAMRWLLYPFKAIFFIRLSFWQPEVDLPLIAIAVGIVVIFFLVHPFDPTLWSGLNLGYLR